MGVYDVIGRYSYLMFPCKVSAFSADEWGVNQLDEVCVERATNEFSEVGEVLVCCMEDLCFGGVQFIFERWAILAVGLEDVVVHHLVGGVQINICWREKVVLVSWEGHDGCPCVTVV